ncbi:Ferric aerobactin receptor precursor [Escherichia coli]|nr:Ferric aerobactin receptor precursor [Escherichia coli]
MGAGTWSLRVQSTTSFDVSDAEGNDINGYTTVDFISSGSFRWEHSASALRTSSTVTIPLSGDSVHLCTTARVTALLHCTTTRPGPNLWSELLSAVLTGMLLQQGYAVNNMVLGGHVVYSQYNIQP